jgi:CheY-like chemotaxis protein
MVLASSILHDHPGARVDEAENGQAAFYIVQDAYLNGWRYDLVFMDMNMPDFDGSVGLSMIRGFEKRNKIAKKTDICAVSGDDFEDTQGVDEGHVLAKIKKPVSMELIRWLLNKVRPS